MRVNYHTHTARCGHATGEDEQYVLAAIEAGFEVLGFSDHVPFEGIHAPRDRMDFDQLEGYAQSILDLKKRYAEVIDIKLGFEIEFFADQTDYYKRLRRIADYLIQGQHFRELNFYGYDQYNNDADLGIYVSQLVAGMESGLVDLVAHPEYFMLGRRSWNQACIEAAHTIAQTAARTGIPLEINLNGFKFGKRDYDGYSSLPYPFMPFWEIAGQYPIKAIFGIDAHKPLNLLDRNRSELFIDELTRYGVKIDPDFRF